MTSYSSPISSIFPFSFFIEYKIPSSVEYLVKLKNTITKLIC